MAWVEGCPDLRFAVSLDHWTVSRHESLSGLDSPPCCHSIRSSPTFFFSHENLDLRFPAFVCIAVRQTDLRLVLSSHPGVVSRMCASLQHTHTHIYACMYVCMSKDTKSGSKVQHIFKLFLLFNKVLFRFVMLQ